MCKKQQRVSIYCRPTLFTVRFLFQEIEPDNFLYALFGHVSEISYLDFQVTRNVVEICSFICM